MSITLALLGLLMIALAVPLYLRKVPMNGWYGVRIPRAFVSDHNWYEINWYGAKALFGYGGALVCLGFVSTLLPAVAPPWVPVLLLLAPLVLLVPMLVAILRFSSRCPDGRQGAGAAPASGRGPRGGPPCS
ncbi:MAG: SdpI family protein [Acidobacteriota bacterium]